jgi:hypothetical protein
MKVVGRIFMKTAVINFAECCLHCKFKDTGLSPGFVMHERIPIATVRLRHKKTVRQYVLVVLEY